MWHMMTVATDIADISANLQIGVIAWGTAAIGIGVIVAGVAWIKKMMD